jgi:hypothetical protein
MLVQGTSSDRQCAFKAILVRVACQTVDICQRCMAGAWFGCIIYGSGCCQLLLALQNCWRGSAEGLERHPTTLWQAVKDGHRCLQWQQQQLLLLWVPASADIATDTMHQSRVLVPSVLFAAVCMLFSPFNCAVGHLRSIHAAALLASITAQHSSVLPQERDCYNCCCKAWFGFDGEGV